MTHTRLFTRPLFGLSLVLVVGAVVGAMAFFQIMRMHQARNIVAHTYEVIGHIDELVKMIAIAESSQRGYLITDADEHLISYREYTQIRDKNGQHQVEKKIHCLQNLTADNPNQQKNLEILHTVVEQKIIYMNQLIQVAQTHSLDRAQDLSKDGQGQRLMNSIKFIAERMRNEEHRLLAERTQAHSRITHTNILITTALILLLLTLSSIAFIAIQHEMSRRQALEKSLREMDAFHRGILNSTLYTIIAVDKLGIIRMFNPAAEQLLGYKAEEVIGKKTPAIFHDPKEAEEHAEWLRKELGDTIDPHFDVYVHKPLLVGAEEREWTYIRKDGTRIPVLLCITPLRDNRGQVTGFMGVAKDISERKYVDKMKNEFISTVSHELRTPLTSIRGSLGLIIANVAGDIPEKARGLLDIAYKNSERLTRLINDILDIEKIESGSIVFDNRPLFLSKVLRQAIEENQGFAEKYGVTLCLQESGTNIMILSDFDRLLQVMANLLSNAIKYSPSGGTVTVTCTAKDDKVTIAIRDQGVGIPEEFKGKIFEKFAQADSSDTRQKGGTGLGLSISKAIVEMLGGTIGFESVPGNTTFFVTLPELQRTSTYETSSLSVSTGMRSILICEDDSDIAQLLQGILRNEGFVCDVAATARQAKDFLIKKDYAAMTLDLGLPDQDGLALIRELRMKDGTTHLPIIVISASAEEGQRKLNGQAVGIMDWLPKPLDFDRLKRVLHNLPTGPALPAVLHVEDDRDIAHVIAVALQNIARVTSVTTLGEARHQIDKNTFDLAMLDILLPDGNGLDLLPLLAEKVIPAIILSVNEASRDIQERVIASMVKSSVPEEKIIRIIKAFLEERSVR